MNERKIRKMIMNSLPLISDRVMLRYIELSDAYDMYEYASIPEVSEYLLWSPHINLTSTEGYIEFLCQRYKKGLYADWALVLKETGKMIGTCGYASLDLKQKEGEIGYVLSPYYRKKGYMTEAVDMLLNFSFEKIGLERIKLRIMSENADSIRLAEKFGFTKKEVTYMDVKDIEREIFHYELLKEDYESK